MGLFMVMTLTLLVYAIGQRRLHQALKNLEETLPNQIFKETAKPILRWIFQLLDGIDLVKMDEDKDAKKTHFRKLGELEKKSLDPNISKDTC